LRKADFTLRWCTSHFCAATTSNEEQADGVEPHDKGEDLLEVNSLALYISFGDEASLVLDDGALLVPLYLENPFQPNELVTSWQNHQGPSAILLDGVHLLQYCLAPARVALGFCDVVWFLHRGEQQALSESWWCGIGA
jgi:hypothetical protein